MSSELKSLSEALKNIAPEKLPHGIEQYSRFGPKTALAILALRDLVVHTPDLGVRIGLTDDPSAAEAEERQVGCVDSKLSSSPLLLTKRKSWRRTSD